MFDYLRSFGNFLAKKNFGNEDNEIKNSIAHENSDGAVEFEDLFSFRTLSLDFTHKSQVDLINVYRSIAQHTIVDYAIEDIVNEMVSFTEQDIPVELDLSDTELSENIRKKIHASWEKLSNILDLKNTIHRKARSFYIDGRLVHQKVVDDKNLSKGIIDLVELDSRTVFKMREIKYDEEKKTLSNIKEYFVYDDTALQEQDTKQNRKTTKKDPLILNPNIISYTTSGIIDSKTGFTASWLHKAIRPANLLAMMENALVIYRIVRAPERRIFYISTGGLPPKAAKKHLAAVQSDYRNKMKFDPTTGKLSDSKWLQTMQEDFWLPRDSEGRGTEVSTLPSGQNLGEIEDVLFFLKQLYKALNIPESRLDTNAIFGGARGVEINRDELKFSKFVSSIRKRLNMFFLDILKTDLILTNVMTADEWDKIKDDIVFKYAKDLHIEEMKAAELLRERVNIAVEMEPFVGKYFSHKYVRESIFQQTDADIQEEDEQIKEESKDPRYSSNEEE